MKTTMNLDAELVERAKQLSGIEQTTRVVHEGLRALIAREAARRLAALGGTEPDFKAPRRRRPA